MTVDLVLYQPDIAQNTGTLLRLGACLGVAVHIAGNSSEADSTTSIRPRSSNTTATTISTAGDVAQAADWSF